jgi:beta-barrel assembly-enhancing protease
MKSILSIVALATTLACVPCSAAGQFDFGALKSLADKVKQGVDAFRDFSEPEEIAIGQEMASNLLGAAPLYPDQNAQRYVNRVGHLLANQTERANLEWHFAVLDDAELNAFAAPGGYIFITKGMLLSMRNEAELAGVLSHEIVHVLKKHHLAAIKTKARTALGAELASNKLEASGVTQNGQLTPLFHQLANVGTGLFISGLSKEDEFEADRMGVVIATRAGYNPYGLPSVLQALQTVSSDSEGVKLMFATHPPFDKRLEQLALVMTQPFDQFENQPELTERFVDTLAPPKANSAPGTPAAKPHAKKKAK